MIFEYAISPGYCSEKNSIKNMRDNFGLEKGRIISQSPINNWMKLVHNIIKKSDYPPVMRKKMRNTVNKMEREKAIYRRNETNDIKDSDWITFNEKLWLEFTEATHKIRPFKAILSEENIFDNPYCISFNDFDLTENSYWVNPHEVKVKRDHKTMIETIKPLLDCSNQIILVDPYFTPWEDRFKSVLVELIETLSNRNHSPKIMSLIYHTGDAPRKLKKDYHVHQNEFEHYFIKNFKHEDLHRIKIVFVVWPRKELHARFIMTDMGGVRFDPGLDESLGHNLDKVSITRLAKDTYKEEWANFNNWHNLSRVKSFKINNFLS